MNLTLVLNLYLPSMGGVETAVNNLSKQFLKKGYAINIVTSKYPFYLKSQEFIDGINVYRLPFPSLIALYKPLFLLPINLIVKIALFPYTIYKMYRWFKRNRIEIVNIHYIGYYALTVLFTSYICKFKLVASLHGFNVCVLPFVSKRKSWIFRKVLERANYITACSESLLIDAQKRVPQIKEKCKVIPNGVNLDEFKHREKYQHPNPYIFSLANFYDFKGLDILIMAFKEVSEKHSNVDLIIAGDGNLRENLKELAGLLGLKQKVIFLGCISDRKKIVELFNGCEFFVLPSRCEPSGIVNLEAMAAGKAVISTNNCGVPEIVKDGINGILVKPKNDKALAEAIIRLLEDIDLRNKLGENGKKMVEWYSWDKAADSYSEIYEKILDDN